MLDYNELHLISAISNVVTCLSIMKKQVTKYGYITIDILDYYEVTTVKLLREIEAIHKQPN